jgi:alpha-ribazole phosphatase
MSRISFYWIRHAPPINPDGICYGQADIPVDLSDSDRIARMARILPDTAQWVTSPSTRARDTLAALAQAKNMGTVDPVVVPGFLEQSFGAWQSMKKSDLASDPDFRAYLAAPGTVRPPQGESMRDLFLRVSSTIAHMIPQNTCKNIIIGAHGGTIRAALALALDRPVDALLKEKIDPLSLTIISRARDNARDWRVDAINLHP